MIATIASYVRRHHLGAIALFVALGGSAYAASLPRDSVGSSQVRDHSLWGYDLHRGVLPAWAEVRGDGTFVHSAGMRSLGHNPNDIYELSLRYSRSTRCVFLATIGDTPGSAASIRAHPAGVGERGDFVVEVRDSAGNLTNGTFNVAAIC